jgi:four helix bundle protein
VEKKKMQSYKDLIAYQKAYQLTLDIYKSTKRFSKEELFGIVSQMRRSAVSIPCNISEGYCRNHRKEYVQFLNIALGSCGELETLLSLSRDLGYISQSDFENLYGSRAEVSRILWKLADSLKKRQSAE